MRHRQEPAAKLRHILKKEYPCMASSSGSSRMRSQPISNHRRITYFKDRTGTEVPGVLYGQDQRTQALISKVWALLARASANPSLTSSCSQHHSRSFVMPVEVISQVCARQPPAKHAAESPKMWPGRGMASLQSRL